MKRVGEPSLRKTSNCSLKDERQTTTNGIAEAREVGKIENSLECNEGWHAAGEIIFSDEKMFTVEAKFNSQDDRILAKSADSIPTSCG